MPKIALPPAATPADLPGDVRLQIVSPGTEPPASGGWLHEIKHDGHRLVAIVAGERLMNVWACREEATIPDKTPEWRLAAPAPSRSQRRPQPH